MRAITLFMLVLLLQSCGVEQTKRQEALIKLDTIRNFSNADYDILITKSVSTQETGSSHGPKSLRFLNKELKEVIKTNLKSRSILASFENLKIPPEIISVDFNTFEDLGIVNRDSLLLHVILEAYDLEFERDSIRRQGYWLQAKSDFENLSKESSFSSVSSSSGVKLKGAKPEDLLKSLNLNYSEIFFGVSTAEKTNRYDIEYELRNIERVLNDLENAFHVHDTIIKVRTFRFFQKAQN